MSDQLVYNISLDECVGDSISKHNYNVLSLDTNVCNLSSTFFNIRNNHLSIFSDLCANIENFNDFASVFFEPSDITEAYTATKYLSSYWQRDEFTVTYPVNIYDLDGATKYYVDDSVSNDVISQYALAFLNKNYPSSGFQSRTIANVVFLLFSNTGAVTQTETSSFGVTNKIFNVTQRKSDVYIAKIRVLRFTNSQNKVWTFNQFVT
jgi:hypothetical protein